MRNTTEDLGSRKKTRYENCEFMEEVEVKKLDD